MSAAPCLDDNMLAALFADRTGLDQAIEHAAQCAACRELIAGLTAVNAEEPPNYLQSAPEPSPESSPLEGTVLCERWTLGKHLGTGGMGVVYSATHRNGGRFAIKLMRRELQADPELVERFVSEAYAANAVEHANVVGIVDDDVTADGLPFLVMDLLEGETIRSRLNRLGSLSLEDTLRVADQLTDALSAAHARGVIHRDIKPENLMLIPSGELKVLDFGLARIREGAPHRSRHGVPMGTLGYMPPEQALGQVEKMGPHSDVWSIAATLFTMLSGEKPHKANSRVDEVFMAMTSPVERIHERLPDTPVQIVALLEKALSFTPEHRYRDAAEMRGALLAVSQELGLRLEREAPGRSPLASLSAMPAQVTPAPQVTLPLAQPPAVQGAVARRWYLAAALVITLVLLAAAYALKL